MRGRVAQSVEQRIENPRVDGSIPPPTTTDFKSRRSKDLRLFSFFRSKNKEHRAMLLIFHPALTGISEGGRASRGHCLPGPSASRRQRVPPP